MPHITHIALWTADLERMKAFYQTWFSAQTGEKYTNPKTGFQSYFLRFEGGTPLEIMTAPGVAANEGGKKFGYAHIAFSVGSKEAVIALTEKMQAAGVIELSVPRTTGDGYFESVVTDPDGNPVEITS